MATPAEIIAAIDATVLARMADGHGRVTAGDFTFEYDSLADLARIREMYARAAAVSTSAPTTSEKIRPLPMMRLGL